MEFTTTEILGYLASFIVLLSFLMKDMKTLRRLNIVGCGIFIIYGLMLPSIPVIITNGAIVLINIYYLSKKEN
jgi:hypothetical protein